MADKITPDATGTPSTAPGAGNVVSLAAYRATHRHRSPHVRQIGQPQSALPNETLPEDDLDFVGDMFLDPHAGPQFLVAPSLDRGATRPLAIAVEDRDVDQPD
jgi:hypothetical protein